ncbi:hypothetical protein DRQ50_14600 [bacterium]|nr:MAG: hypothetical protein DRQ50_14600 [bacterium]
MNFSVEECYRILEVIPPLTPEDLKAAYKQQIKVWHPDRFAGDPDLQKKAQERIKAINEAFAILKNKESQSYPKPSNSPAGSDNTDEALKTEINGVVIPIVIICLFISVWVVAALQSKMILWIFLTFIFCLFLFFLSKIVLDPLRNNRPGP